jgi:predicted neuraminidase
MKKLLLTLAICMSICGATNEQPGLVTKEFIFETAPFASCHASTIVETKDGFAAAWFGGTDEGNKDVGIWVSRLRDGKWSAPVEVVNGVQNESLRYPCWNPVLFQLKSGPLVLFYKVGPSPSKWWGMKTFSSDGGQTWGTPDKLPEGFIGPVKNKPALLSNGDLLAGSSTEDKGWRVHFERSSDSGGSWTKIGPINDGVKIGAIQPSILNHGGGRLQAIGRTRQNFLFSTESKDDGATWSEMTLLELPNPNSGTDALTLKDGRHLLVYNHSGGRLSQWDFGRHVLNVAVSKDGKNWEAALILEKETTGEYSYPAVIQSADGMVHATYTWQRKRIRHVVIDPAKLQLKPIVKSEWPK